MDPAVAYIIGEKLRSGSVEARAALSRQGRYQEVAGNLRVKEVRIAEDERFVICRSPEGAERDAAVRARLIAQLRELIDGTDKLARDKRAELGDHGHAQRGLSPAWADAHMASPQMSDRERTPAGTPPSRTPCDTAC